MRVAAAPRSLHSIRRVFVLIRDFCRRSGLRRRMADFECSPAAPLRVKRRKRTRKRFRRSPAKTHTRLTIQKLKRGGCLLAASFPGKRLKSCARASRQQALTRPSKDRNRKPSRKSKRLQTTARFVLLHVRFCPHAK